MNDGGTHGTDARIVLDRLADTPLTLISFISLIGRFFSVTGVFSIMSSVESAPSITLRGVRGQRVGPIVRAWMATAETTTRRDDDGMMGMMGMRW